MTDRPNTTDGGAAPRSEASQAESELDKLLKGFDDGTKPEKPAEPTVKLVKDLEPVIRFAQETMEKNQRDKIEADIDAAIGFLLEPEELKAVPKILARGYLEAHAAKDRSFVDAYRSRDRDSKAYQAKLAEARTAFAEVMKEFPANKIKTDIAAAKAAVSGQTQSAEDAVDYEKKVNGMTDREVLAFRAQQLAQSRRY